MLEYCIRTVPARQHFVRSHSFSHHHDHHRHHYRTRCFDNCAGISLEKWNKLCEQNKDLIANNDILSRENQTLKADLQTSTQETSRLVAYSQQLYDELAGLRRSHTHDGENMGRFARRVADLKTEIDNKDKHIHRLEKRVDVLTGTVSDTNQEISYWRGAADDFESRLSDVTRRLEKAKRLLSERARELDQSNAIVEDQRRTIRRLETTLPHRRHYSFA
ncbi:hypothetical protein GGS26DRAFT_77945 [Hypomontagnella submonticulosa]|nr:hypothetical protein GGS26DRAFT_77945 [Hypomontagnella submonticulosa]